MFVLGDDQLLAMKCQYPVFQDHTVIHRTTSRMRLASWTRVSILCFRTTLL